MINNPQEQSNIDNLINQIKHQKSNQKKQSMDKSNHETNSTDNLLEQFKSDLKQQKEKSQQHNLDNNKPEIHKNLQQFKQQQQEKSQEHNVRGSQPEVNENLHQFKQQFQHKQKEKSQEHNVERNKPEINENLHQFKQQFQHKQEEQRETITHQNQEEIRYTEQRKQRQQKLLIRQAEQWLKSLDEYSDEGLWFESFSRSYPSRLDAAMEYLAVLNASS